MVGSFVIRLAAPLWWSMKIPDEDTIRKGRPRKNPKMVPINTSLSMRKTRSVVNVTWVSPAKISFGRIMAAKQRPITIFTGAGRIRAPKNGESPMIGPIRPMARIISDRTESGLERAEEPSM